MVYNSLWLHTSKNIINVSELCEYHSAVLWVLVYNAKQSNGQLTSRICAKPCVFLVHIEACPWKLSHTFIKFKKDFAII